MSGHTQGLQVLVFTFFFKNYFLPFFLKTTCLDTLRPFLVKMFTGLMDISNLIIFVLFFVCFIYILYFFNFLIIKFFHHIQVMCALLNNNPKDLVLLFFILYPFPENFIFVNKNKDIWFKKFFISCILLLIQIPLCVYKICCFIFKKAEYLLLYMKNHLCLFW